MDRSQTEQNNPTRLSVNQISQILKRTSGLGEPMAEFPTVRPVLPRINRQAIRLKLEEAVVRLSLEHPGWGPERLSAMFKSAQTDIGAHTIYNILNKYQMATKNERLQALELEFAADPSRLSEEQLKMLEKKNPALRQRKSRGLKPGELLIQDAIYIGVLQNMSEVYLQLVIDTYSNYAFGFLYVNKAADSAVSILHNDVLPFFQQIQRPAVAILTDNGREYCGKKNHHYELYLTLNHIEHRRTKPRKAVANQLVKDFIRISFTEFFKKNWATPPENLEIIQKMLDRWLHDYNVKRPRQDYPNMGRSPMAMIREYLTENKPQS